MSDILIIKTSSLGDVIHQMPALTEARRRLPQARFSWVVEEAFAPLVRLHPAVSDVIPVATRRWRQALFSPVNWRDMARFTSALRAKRYDEIIDTQGLFRSALLARVARGRRQGYNSASVRERAAAALYDVRHRVPRDLHAIERNRRLTGLALGYRSEGGVDFGLNRARLAPVSDGYGILLHATARAEKEWAGDRWQALGKALAARTGSLVLPWGSEAERVRSVRIAAVLDRARVPERESLDRVAVLIAGASFVIGVDTGLLHLAAALDVPVVGIFVGSEAGLTGPIGTGPIAVVGGKGQSPSVADVLDALDRVL